MLGCGGGVGAAVVGGLLCVCRRRHRAVFIVVYSGSSTWLSLASSHQPSSLEWPRVQTQSAHLCHCHLYRPFLTEASHQYNQSLAVRLICASMRGWPITFRIRRNALPSSHVLSVPVNSASSIDCGCCPSLSAPHHVEVTRLAKLAEL